MIKRVFAFIVLLVILKMSSFSQISVTPPGLFITNDTRSGAISVINNRYEASEIEMELKFGYIGFDSLGRNSIVYDDKLIEESCSIKPFVTFYPKKFILQGRQQQDVKFLVKNTNSLADGTYWTRIITRSKEVKKQIDTTNIQDSVKIDLTMILEYTTLLVFQKGKLNTNVDVSGLNVETDSMKLRLMFDFKRAGNSPFFGSAKVKILNSEGDKVAEKDEILPIYFNSKKSIVFDKGLFKPGNYKVQIRLTDEQPDIPAENKVPFVEMTKTFDFSFNPFIQK
mgnify:CR=1 FL=1